MNKLSNVVVGIDFSVRSGRALREAQRIAQWDGAAVTAVHILDEQVIGDLNRRVEVVQEDMLAAAQARLENRVTEVLGEGHGVRSLVIIGHPFHALVLAAGKEAADLLVLGSCGSVDDPARVGTVAGKCLRKAPFNVLLVRDREPTPFRKVAVGVDFSETSIKAARHAVQIALQDGAELVFAHIHQPPAVMVDDPAYFGTLDAALMEEWDEELFAADSERLRAFAAERIEEAAAGELKWRAETVRHVNVRAAISELLQDEKADLAVIGTIGRTGLKSLLLGTTAEKVIHHAPCSVLTVKPDGFGYELGTPEGRG